MTRAEDVALVLELAGGLLDVLLVGDHPLLLVAEPFRQCLELRPLGTPDPGGLGELGLDEDLVGAIQVLTDDLGLIEGPLRSEEHTSELQSRLHLVCRLLLEKKKQQTLTAGEREA